jgi:hypothetical protein
VSEALLESERERESGASDERGAVLWCWCVCVDTVLVSTHNTRRGKGQDVSPRTYPRVVRKPSLLCNDTMSPNLTAPPSAAFTRGAPSPSSLLLTPPPVLDILSPLLGSSSRIAGGCSGWGWVSLPLNKRHLFYLLNLPWIVGWIVLHHQLKPKTFWFLHRWTTPTPCARCRYFQYTVH